MDVGETVENATIREVKEETNIDIDITALEQFKVYSDPHRDSRRHTVSVVFRAVVRGVVDIKSGDDAKAVKLIPLSQILNYQYDFDHKLILTEYIKKYH